MIVLPCKVFGSLGSDHVLHRGELAAFVDEGWIGSAHHSVLADARFLSCVDMGFPPLGPGSHFSPC